MEDQENKPTLKDNIRRISYAAGYGGGQQALIEAAKIVTNTAPDKFPKGWESYNITEEFLEGALPAITGALIGKATYRILLDKTGAEFNDKTEVSYMAVGAVMGYTSMALFGAVIHVYLDVDDVKWGPFK